MKPELIEHEDKNHVLTEKLRFLFDDIYNRFEQLNLNLFNFNTNEIYPQQITTSVDADEVDTDIDTHEDTYDHSLLHARSHAIDSTSDHTSTIVEDNVITANASGLPKDSGLSTTTTLPICLGSYDAEPSRGSESNIHGGILSLATGQPLDSVPTNIVVSKGIGKLIVVINAGSDVSGSITVTGTSVDRDTGATSGADTDTLTVDALTTDGSSTDSNGNTKHSFTGAYITSKWFTGSVTLSTADLTLTDVDVYHASFEQCNDKSNLTINTFDANIFTTNTAAEFDAYLYSLEVTGDKCDISLEAELHVGADGETALANKYWRLRRGNIAKALDGSTDGLWCDVHYSNSPAYVEDVTLKIWISQETSLTTT